MRQIWATMPQTLARLFQSDRVFAGLLALCYVFYLTPAGTNTLSRYDMVYALAHGTAIIDIHAGNTIDVSYYQGHWYSPRSLGLSLLATPLLWLLSHITTIHKVRYDQLCTLTQKIAFFTNVLVYRQHVKSLLPAIKRTFHACWHKYRCVPLVRAD